MPTYERANGTLQIRNPRKLLESPEEDWTRWKAAAARLGLNWSDFARRAQDRLAAEVLGGKTPLLSIPAKPRKKRGQ